MDDRALADKLEELYALIETLAQRIHDLEQPANHAPIKPCNHFSDLVTALEAIHNLASIYHDSEYQPTGRELAAIHKIASTVLAAKQGASCPRWRIFFDPDVT